MKLSDASAKLESAISVAGCPDAGSSELKKAMQATYVVDAFVASVRAELVQALAAVPAAFPEAVIAETSGTSLGAATKERDRADTLGHASAVADALSDGVIRPGHVDAVTRATKNLDEQATSELLSDDEAIAEAASTRTIPEFDRWIKNKAKGLDTTDPEDRFEKQQRATRVRTWTDDEGMWNLKGPVRPRHRSKDRTPTR